MSLTGKLQGIAARGYRLRWSVEATVEPDYDNLTLALVDANGSVILSNSQRVKVRGGVVTKESEEAQKNALVAWAEEVTRAGVPGPEPRVPSVELRGPEAQPEPPAVPAAVEAADG